MHGKKTEAEILKEPVEFARQKKVDCALALFEQGRSVNPLRSTFGVARSHACLMVGRASDWIDGRMMQTFHKPDKALLADAVRTEITALPTYGCHHAGA